MAEAVLRAMPDRSATCNQICSAVVSMPELMPLHSQLLESDWVPRQGTRGVPRCECPIFKPKSKRILWLQPSALGQGCQSPLCAPLTLACACAALRHARLQLMSFVSVLLLCRWKASIRTALSTHPGIQQTGSKLGRHCIWQLLPDAQWAGTEMKVRRKKKPNAGTPLLGSNHASPN